MRIKICGLTTAQDVQAAAQAGADALGFVFYARSKRGISGGQARELLRHVPPFVQTVGLFVNATAEEIRDILAQVPLDCLQFHGDESPEFCAQFARRWIKAVPMRDLPDARAVAQYCRRFTAADGFLLDAFGRQCDGGSGETFDWRQIPPLDKPWILAGGLNPDNVAAAAVALKPWAVDVSSGVESAPGVKSFARMRRFIEEARAAVL